MQVQSDNKHLLTRSSDRISFLYIEKARIEQTEYSVQTIQGTLYAEIPITTVNCILLGPGTSITHQAVVNITKAGCSIVWAGDNGTSFYAYGEPHTKSSKLLLVQAKAFADKNTHIDVVRKMYQMRYPSDRLKTKTVEELRGIEGMHVRTLYSELAEKHLGSEWKGRQYTPGDFGASDVINQYLTALNHILYAICEAVIVALGLSPGLGFIHTGNTLSFVYDIADLYKERLTIPAAFILAEKSEYYDQKTARTVFREMAVKQKLLSNMVKDIKHLFGEEITADNDVQIQLWDPKKFVNSGKNYF